MEFESARDIEAWLIKSLSEEIEIPIEDINPSMSFAGLGVDSIESVGLACELDAKFDTFTVKPELFWQVDSIHELAEELFARDRAAQSTIASALKVPI
jgi:acyl carrier protein